MVDKNQKLISEFVSLSHLLLKSKKTAFIVLQQSNIPESVKENISIAFNSRNNEDAIDFLKSCQDDNTKLAGGVIGWTNKAIKQRESRNCK